MGSQFLKVFDQGIACHKLTLSVTTKLFLSWGKKTTEKAYEMLLIILVSREGLEKTTQMFSLARASLLAHR